MDFLVLKISYLEGKRNREIERSVRGRVLSLGSNFLQVYKLESGKVRWRELDKNDGSVWDLG